MTAAQIAAAIPAAMLDLTARLLVADVMAVYHVSHYRAVSIVEAARERHGYH